MGSFGANLGAILKERGWNQPEAARRLGVPQSTLNRYLSGEREPSLEMVQKITKALELPIGTLTGEDVHALREAGKNYMERSDIPALESLRGLRRRYQNRVGDRRQIELAIEMLFGDEAKPLIKWLGTKP